MTKMLSPNFTPRRPIRGFLRYALFAVIVMLCFYSFSQTTSQGERLRASHDDSTHSSSTQSKPDRRPVQEALTGHLTPIVEEDGTTVKENTKGNSHHLPQKPASAESSSRTFPDPDPNGGHPIDKLIYDAQHNYAELLSKESKTIEEAAQAYRKRRGRHPPPNFDKWWTFAKDRDALVVEDFFDQIYDDLQPFWGLDPAIIRKESWDFEMTLHVRNGKANITSDWFWTVIWYDMIGSIEHLLPDMDLALNAMDEPRLVVPWEDMNVYMQKAAKTTGFAEPDQVVSKFQKLPKPGKGDRNVASREKKWENIKPYWPVARRGCAPDSLARTTELQESFEEPPTINNTYAEAHMHEGYVSNYTMSTNICHQPDLQGLEGVMIAPQSTSATKVLFPMFGGSKLSVNNEILLPAPMYWNEDERFTGGDERGSAWSEKLNAVVWRGVATGGRNRKENWRGFQRHRFVSMNNGTKVARVEAGLEEAENFALPEEQYHIEAQENGQLGEWILSWTDVSFVDLMCTPGEDDGQCNYTGHYFRTTDGLQMAEQFDYKYTPDIDGNSFSGRYLGFLRSTSLPIKATIFREWHDNRLVPWKHFVPMDNRFSDYYGIMEYFLGHAGQGNHDKAAEKIAMEGQQWADKVLRKEDMQIYVFRLLLEYGRLIDDNREKMGWVNDAVKNPSIKESWKEWQ